LNPHTSGSGGNNPRYFKTFFGGIFCPYFKYNTSRGKKKERPNTGCCPFACHGEKKAGEEKAGYKAKGRRNKRCKGLAEDGRRRGAYFHGLSDFK
jgi:hypothetical protein